LLKKTWNVKLNERRWVEKGFYQLYLLRYDVVVLVEEGVTLSEEEVQVDD